MKQHIIHSFVPMAKVYPQALLSPPTSDSLMTREVLTIWMKSLVMNGNGCTVYDSDGRLVYRVDNYDCKCSDEVYLMDHSGKALIRILKKKLRLFGRWEGYRCSESMAEQHQKPLFSVRKGCRILKGYKRHETTVTVGSGSVNASWYKIERISLHKTEYRITDMAGRIMAEVKRKHTTTGVSLGDDVLSLVVEPNVDQLLVMGLVIVCGLINHSM